MPKAKKLHPGFPFSNRLRTLFSNHELFLPVSQRRWKLAQGFESESWALDDQLGGDEIPTKLVEEQVKARFLISEAERVLNLNLEEQLRDSSVIDVACGPISLVAESTSPALKFGVDPLEYPTWVKDRYSVLDFRLLAYPVESAPFEDFHTMKPPGSKTIVVMYNALQHFRSVNDVFRALSAKLGDHHIFFVDYASVPADDAHPQVLTLNRLRKSLVGHKYSVQKIAQFTSRLDGLVEIGGGRPIDLVAGWASFTKDS